MKGERYALAVSRLGWLMCEFEQTLLASSEGCTIDTTFVRRRITKRLPTVDEARVALDAFADLGVLRNDHGVLSLSKKTLHDTQDFRVGVWQGLNASRADPDKAPSVRVCASLPPELETGVKQSLRREASDLRAAILEIIASARQRLVLASPFWDEETAEEVADLLVRRIEAGVQVVILGRFTEQRGSAVTSTFRHLSRGGKCQVLSWFNVGREKTNVQTFHFKLAVADEGRTAYMGTANFTISGLRSRMELGVIVSGEPARQLYRIINVAIGLARPAF